MKIAVIQFPGSNCERETMLAIKRSGMTPVEFLWNEPSSRLAQMDGYVLIGGFSYEDRSRAGIIAALDPLMNTIQSESEKNKPVLGICNGAQILVETGMVPGLKNNQLAMALTENKRIQDGKILGTGFYNQWINLRLGPNIQANAFTRHLTQDSILSIPIAHAQGRFLMPEALAQELRAEGLQVFQYCDAQGRVIEDFPVNPNGSMHNLAAVMNKAGNVMAIMPHPERCLAGDALFLSMKDYLLERRTLPVSAPLSYVPELAKIPVYEKKPHSQEFIVQLLITDNQALTLQNTLRQMGILVEVSRCVHWQIDCDDLESLGKIKASGILYNLRKEYLLSSQDCQKLGSIKYLVRAKEDLIGQEAGQMLQDHFSIKDLPVIFHSILWIFKGVDTKINDLKDRIIKTNIISNPFAHDLYEYK